MARIVVSEFISIDGVMEAPGGEPGYRLRLVGTQALESGTVLLIYRPAMPPPATTPATPTPTT